jgi:hypothetical protein
LVPEAFFQQEKNRWIDMQIFGKKRRDPAVSDVIFDLKIFLKNSSMNLSGRLTSHSWWLNILLTIFFGAGQ